MGERARRRRTQFKPEAVAAVRAGRSKSEVAAELDLADRLLRSCMICSMSRKGDCWDNAPMGSVFATLEGELVADRNYRARDDPRAQPQNGLCS